MANQTKKKTEQKKLEGKTKRQLMRFEQMQTDLTVLENSLLSNPKFRQFLSVQKKLQEKTTEFWKDLQNEMEKAGVTEITGDWGYVKFSKPVKTYKVVDIDKLDKEFFSEMPDMDKIKQEIVETDEIPDGVEESVTRRFLKKINDSKNLIS